MRNTIFRIFFALLVILIPFSVFAGMEHNLSGWAWSSNIGWISFNSTNDHDPNTIGVQQSAVNYGVNKNSNGTLVGYAWSSNIGWIQFGGLSGFPVGGGTQSQNVDVAGNNPKGWTKALSADNNGWDGWISMSGSGYGVKFTDGTHLTSYAWGGDVVGWVLFDIQSTGICSDCGVKITNDIDLDVLDSNGSSLLGRNDVTYLTVPTFVWTIKNIAQGTSCSVYKSSSGGTPFSKSNLNVSGQETGNALIDSTYTYAISCTNGGITVLTRYTTPFTVLPNPADFSISIDGGSEMPIQFLGSGTADSVEKVFHIIPSNFSSPVTVTVQSVSPPIPNDVTFTYCLNVSCTPMATTTSIVITPPSLGAKFRVRVSKKLDPTPIYDITLRGEGGGLVRNAVFKLTPSVFDPKFEEF